MWYNVKLCNPTDVILTTSVNNIVAEVVYKLQRNCPATLLAIIGKHV